MKGEFSKFNVPRKNKRLEDLVGSNKQVVLIKCGKDGILQSRTRNRMDDRIRKPTMTKAAVHRRETEARVGAPPIEDRKYECVKYTWFISVSCISKEPRNTVPPN